MRKTIGNFLFDLFFLLIITIPSYIVLLNNNYFTMHDDQHIARLFLLDQGIKQGQLFPRWVDMLGFGYGYPLFNFYPPLIYYVSWIFHFVGFSYIWSIKLMLIAGFIFAAIGMFYLIKEMIGRLPAMLGATVYTYFFYHSVTVYVRGAFAEFFTMAILPFVFLGILKIYKNTNIKSLLLFAISWALLILTHPLIAFPSVLFIGLFILVLFLFSKHKAKFIILCFIGGVIGLGLSSFYWLPSMIERSYTLVDTILTKELANYQDHFVHIQQLWYSPWGYGGSVKGLGDGMIFQLGKIPILLVFSSFVMGIVYFIKKKKLNFPFILYLTSFFLMIFSLFMALNYSLPIWKTVKYFSYMQFPWRFFTFTNVFISIVSAFTLYFLQEIVEHINRVYKKYSFILIFIFTVVLIVITIFKYSQYFTPQRSYKSNDAAKTSYEEIAWRVSGTSYEFVPKGVATKKTSLGTTTLAIEKNQLPTQPFEIISGIGVIKIVKNNFSQKIFEINAKTNLLFQLNTYNFPGWKAYVDNKNVQINDNNKLKLITINLKPGVHQVEFKFEHTPIRKTGIIVTIISTFISIILIILGRINYIFNFQFAKKERK